MKTYQILTPSSAGLFSLVQAETPRGALVAMYADIGQGDEPDADLFEETWSRGGWNYAVAVTDRTLEQLMDEPALLEVPPSETTYFVYPGDL